MDDRGYSTARSENWAMPLFERGIRQVFDFPKNSRGVGPGPLPGTQWRDDLLLIEDKVTKHPHVKARSNEETPETKAERAAQVADRSAYAFSFEDWNADKGTVRLVGPTLRGQVRCPNHPPSMRLKATKQHSRGGRKVTRPTTNHQRGDTCSCGKTKTVPIADVIRFYQRDTWGSAAWEGAYGSRNLSETANSNLRDHHGRFAKGSIKMLGLEKITLALAFFVDAVNARQIITMPTDLYERWTGEADPYLPDLQDPTWTDAHYDPTETRAGQPPPSPPRPCSSPALPPPARKHVRTGVCCASTTDSAP